jgi:hypothetical protein
MVVFMQITILQLKRVWGSFINGCVCFVIFVAFGLYLETMFPQLTSDTLNQISMFITYILCLIHIYLQQTSFINNEKASVYGTLGLRQYDLSDGKKIGFVKQSLKISIIYFLFVIISQLDFMLISLLFFLPFGSLITAFEGQYTIIDRLLGIKVLDKDIDLSDETLSSFIFRACREDIYEFVDQNEKMNYSSDEIYLLSSITQRRDIKFDMFKSIDFGFLIWILNIWVDSTQEELEDDSYTTIDLDDDVLNDGEKHRLGEDILHVLHKESDFFNEDTLDWLNLFTPISYDTVLAFIEKLNKSNTTLTNVKIEILKHLSTEEQQTLLMTMASNNRFYHGASLLKPIDSYDSLIRRVRTYLL